MIARASRRRRFAINSLSLFSPCSHSRNTRLTFRVGLLEDDGELCRQGGDELGHLAARRGGLCRGRRSNGLGGRRRRPCRRCGVLSVFFWCWEKNLRGVFFFVRDLRDLMDRVCVSRVCTRKKKKGRRAREGEGRERRRKPTSSNDWKGGHR